MAPILRAMIFLALIAWFRTERSPDPPRTSVDCVEGKDRKGQRRDVDYEATLKIVTVILSLIDFVVIVVDITQWFQG